VDIPDPVDVQRRREFKIITDTVAVVEDERNPIKFIPVDRSLYYI